MKSWNETEFLQRFFVVVLLIIAAVVITANSEAQYYPVIQQGKFMNGSEHQSLNYFWDERTQLCFASATFEITGGERISMFSNVPCTEKVWAVMKGQK